jgi:hypothetical protein
MGKPAWMTDELDEAWVEHPALSGSINSKPGSSPPVSTLDFGSLVINDSFPVKSAATRNTFGHAAPSSTHSQSPVSETGTLVLNLSPTGSETAAKSQVAWAAAAIGSKNILEMSDDKLPGTRPAPGRLAGLFNPPTPPETGSQSEPVPLFLSWSIPSLTFFIKLFLLPMSRHLHKRLHCLDSPFRLPIDGLLGKIFLTSPLLGLIRRNISM